MAIYHCSAKVIGRSGGRAAAYRAGEKIKDGIWGLIFDYSHKQGVDHKEIITPDGAPDWAGDRSRLWNEVEASEKRRDAQLAREVVVSLPRELSARENLNLVSMFSRVSFADRGMVADVTVHHAGSKNPHAHILLTTREIGPEGFGKKNRDWNRKELLQEWRAEWSRHANKALELAGLDSHFKCNTVGLRGRPRRV